MSERFYFVIYQQSKNAFSVIDLSHVVSYERAEFPAVDAANYPTPALAISAARLFAKYNNAVYAPFVSRYDSALSEKWTELTSISRHTLLAEIDDTMSALLSAGHGDDVRSAWVYNGLDIQVPDVEQLHQISSFLSDASNDTLSSVTEVVYGRRFQIF